MQVITLKDPPSLNRFFFEKIIEQNSTLNERKESPIKIESFHLISQIILKSVKFTTLRLLFYFIVSSSKYLSVLTTVLVISL
jgi:hypothetical protein